MIYDVNYSTFWNDFSHYSIYAPGASTSAAPPIDYSAVNQDQSMFQELEQYIDFENENIGVQFSRNEFAGDRWEENFEVQELEQQVGQFAMYAHIPQDFNLDIETNGSITGVNPGDSKFLGS